MMQTHGHRGVHQLNASRTTGSSDRYWKLRMAVGSAIVEIQFYSGSQLLITGTANGVASANAQANSEYVFDGISSIMCPSWKSLATDAWVQYVFNQAPPVITRVVVRWYPHYVADLSHGPSYLDSSSDGATWTTQYTVTQGMTHG